MFIIVVVFLNKINRFQIVLKIIFHIIIYTFCSICVKIQVGPTILEYVRGKYYDFRVQLAFKDPKHKLPSSSFYEMIVVITILHLFSIKYRTSRKETITTSRFLWQ